MARKKPVDRDAYLDDQEAALVKLIEEKQKALRLTRLEKSERAEKERQHGLYLLGCLVDDVGLGGVPQDELRVALGHLAVVQGDAVAWSAFLEGNLMDAAVRFLELTGTTLVLAREEE